MVRGRRLELPWVAPLAPKASASTISPPARRHVIVMLPPLRSSKQPALGAVLVWPTGKDKDQAILPCTAVKRQGGIAIFFSAYLLEVFCG